MSKCLQCGTSRGKCNSELIMRRNGIGEVLRGSKFFDEGFALQIGNIHIFVIYWASFEWQTDITSTVFGPSDIITSLLFACFISNTCLKMPSFSATSSLKKKKKK